MKELEMNPPIVLLGGGLVCVGATPLAAGVALQLHELKVVHDVGAPARADEGAEALEKTRRASSSVDAVVWQLRRVRWLLAHRCEGCGEQLETFTAGAPCPSCANGWSLRLAEPGSRVARGRAFLEAVRRGGRRRDDA